MDNFDKEGFEITLKQNGIEGRIEKRTVGPTMEHLWVKLSPGTPISKVTKQQQNLALYLKLPSLVIEPQFETGLMLFSYMKSERFYPALEHLGTNPEGMELPVGLGLDMYGIIVYKDIVSCVHAIIAGSSGSGKSVLLHSILSSLLRKSTRELQLVLVDPKNGAEFGCYKDIPHHFDGNGVITDPLLLCDVLYHVIKISNQRYTDFARMRVTSLKEYNARKHPTERLPYIVVVIDELADLMGTYKKAIEPLLQSLVQKARASGIHLLLATQRPSVRVITGDIKANCPTRIALRVQTMTDSRVILDRNGAESLLGNGDMLFSQGTTLQRIQAPYLSREQIAEIVKQSINKEYTNP